VPPDDPVALGAALARLLRDPATAAALAARGHARVVPAYGWPRVAAAYLALCDEVRVATAPRAAAAL
jgi:glycosyltransferase involved in cell wall biosynthesis